MDKKVKLNLKTFNLAAHSFVASESKAEKSCKSYILNYYELPGSESNLKYFDSLRSLKSSSAFSLHLILRFCRINISFITVTFNIERAA